MSDWKADYQSLTEEQERISAQMAERAAEDVRVLASALQGAFLSQRQDSLHAQMLDAIRLIERAGCYDAADWIKKRYGQYGEIEGLDY